MSIALRPFSVSSSFDDVSGVPKNYLWGLSKLSPDSTYMSRRPFEKSAACRCESRSSNNYDRIPWEFREENLKERLKRNYESFPQSMYGLTPSQMDMFMTENNPVTRQATQDTEESISSARSYIGNGGMHSLNGMEASSKYNMSVSVYRGGGQGYGRIRSAPPDLPSLLLDA